MGYQLKSDLSIDEFNSAIKLTVFSEQQYAFEWGKYNILRTDTRMYAYLNSDERVLGWVVASDPVNCGSECYIYSFGSIQGPNQYNIQTDMLRAFIQHVKQLDSTIAITLVPHGHANGLIQMLDEEGFVPYTIAEDIEGYRYCGTPSKEDIDLMFAVEDNRYHAWQYNVGVYDKWLTEERINVAIMRDRLIANKKGDIDTLPQLSEDWGKFNTAALEGARLAQEVQDSYMRWAEQHGKCRKATIVMMERK